MALQFKQWKSWHSFAAAAAWNHCRSRRRIGWVWLTSQM